MKYLVFPIVIFVLLSAIVFAIPNPSATYCLEVMGYDYVSENCLFPDGESCNAWDFYNGTCGAEYVKELDCIDIGESNLPGTVCCLGGLVPKQAISEYATFDDLECVQSEGAWPICIPCGNGVCNTDYENKCNCPEDCGTKCSDCVFPCKKSSCEILTEDGFPCVFIQDLTGQYCTAKYLCWKIVNNVCVEVNDADTCLSECVDDSLSDCFSGNIYNTNSACQAALVTTTVTTTTITQTTVASGVPSCWKCEPEFYETWNSRSDPYCDSYGYYDCGETSDTRSECYQAACKVQPPDCWSGTVGQYDSSYGDGICEDFWGATYNANSACYDPDCDVSSCNDYKTDDICDDTPSKCGSFFKLWTSMVLCDECSTGGFNCTSSE